VLTRGSTPGADRFPGSRAASTAEIVQLGGGQVGPGRLAVSGRAAPHRFANQFWCMVGERSPTTRKAKSVRPVAQSDSATEPCGQEVKALYPAWDPSLKQGCGFGCDVDMDDYYPGLTYECLMGTCHNGDCTSVAYAGCDDAPSPAWHRISFI
jgi:hypothetical protein